MEALPLGLYTVYDFASGFTGPLAACGFASAGNRCTPCAAAAALSSSMMPACVVFGVDVEVAGFFCTGFCCTFKTGGVVHNV